MWYYLSQGELFTQVAFNNLIHFLEVSNLFVNGGQTIQSLYSSELCEAGRAGVRCCIAKTVVENV